MDNVLEIIEKQPDPVNEKESGGTQVTTDTENTDEAKEVVGKEQKATENTNDNSENKDNSGILHEPVDNPPIPPEKEAYEEGDEKTDDVKGSSSAEQPASGSEQNADGKLQKGSQPEEEEKDDRAEKEEDEKMDDAKGSSSPEQNADGKMEKGSSSPEKEETTHAPLSKVLSSEPELDEEKPKKKRKRGSQVESGIGESRVELSTANVVHSKRLAKAIDKFNPSPFRKPGLQRKKKK